LGRICVFCGSSRGRDPRYTQAAQTVGRILAESGHGLVYGGGRVGLMGALAEAVLARGGEIIGVLPEVLVGREVAHDGLSLLHVVPTMHARKSLMYELADAFLVLPGGFGTLDELFEVLTWAHLGLHGKPVGLLDVAGYFDPLVKMLDHAVHERFLSPESRALVRLLGRPEEILVLLEAPQA
jgi:uncharacterized protein (TIGR00730 family)